MRAFVPQSVSTDTSSAKHQSVGRQVLPCRLPLSATHSYDFVVQRKSDCACGGGCPSCSDEERASGIQTKLQISNPGDQLEVEADRVADDVMRMAGPTSGQSLRLNPNGVAGGLDEPGRVLRKIEKASRQASAVSDLLEYSGSGQQLDSDNRTYFERRFGYEFSNVRVHTDEAAADSARALGALAYTIGTDIVFGPKQFAPDTTAGRHLLAHELAHVVQNDRASANRSTIRRLVRNANVSCWHPAQEGHGGLFHPRRTGDDVVASIAEADTRAITVAQNAEDQIRDLRANRTTAGYVPNAVLRNAFQTRFNIDVMTVSDNQLRVIQRRYQRIREILAGGSMHYSCRGSDCEAGDWAYSSPGLYRIHLCNRFYPDTLNERGGTILHEAFHIYFEHIEDWEAAALANAHCYEQVARLILGDNPATEPCS